MIGRTEFGDVTSRPLNRLLRMPTQRDRLDVQDQPRHGPASPAKSRHNGQTLLSSGRPASSAKRWTLADGTSFIFIRARCTRQSRYASLSLVIYVCIEAIRFQKISTVLRTSKKKQNERFPSRQLTPAEPLLRSPRSDAYRSVSELASMFVCGSLCQ